MLPAETRKKLGTVLTWGGGLLAVGLAAPFIVMTVKGLLGLALALVLGLALVHFAPYLAMKLANLGLKARKHEAATNPIETLQHQVMLAQARLKQAEQELVTFNTERRNFEGEVRTLNYEHPEDAAEFNEQLEALEKLAAYKEQKLAEATTEIKQMEAAIRRASAKWKVAQAAIRMNKLTGQAANSQMDKILQTEAIGSVQTAMNRAMAEMDVAMSKTIGSTAKGAA